MIPIEDLIDVTLAIEDSEEDEEDDELSSLDSFYRLITFITW